MIRITNNNHTHNTNHNDDNNDNTLHHNHNPHLGLINPSINKVPGPSTVNTRGLRNTRIR